MSETQNASPTEAGSVKERAADEAGRVAESAMEKASEVVGTAADQATMVVDDAKAHVRSIVDEMRSEIQSQAGAKTADAASRLRTLATEMDALGQGRPDEAQQLTRYLSQAHDKVDGFASRLEERGATGLVDDISGFARRRPGVFLLCSMGAGFALGRVLRSGVAANQESGGPQPQLEHGYDRALDDGAIPIGSGVPTSSYGEGVIRPTTPEETSDWERNYR